MAAASRNFVSTSQATRISTFGGRPLGASASTAPSPPSVVADPAHADKDLLRTGLGRRSHQLAKARTAGTDRVVGFGATGERKPDRQRRLDHGNAQVRVIGVPAEEPPHLQPGAQRPRHAGAW